MSNIVLNYISNVNTTINEFLSSKHYSDNNVYELIKKGNVLVNEYVVKGKNHKVNVNDKICIKLNDEENDLKRNETPLDIRYEDQYLLIVNKPSNLDIEPSRYNQINNLASMVSYYYDTIGVKSKIHLVNRLDNPTSGLVIIAKNRYIKNLFKFTKIEKYYYALLEGHLTSEGTIVNHIFKDKDGKRKVSTEYGKKCITEYKVEKYIDNDTLVSIHLVTGRTHQIRATFSSIGHPLIGDKIYNDHETNESMLLKANALQFIHPITEESVQIKI